MIKLVVIALLITLAFSKAPVRRATNGKGIDGSWVVVYETGVTALTAAKHKQQLSIIDPNSRVVFDYTWVYTGFSGFFSDEAINYLAAQPGVKYIEQDQVVTINQECKIQTNAEWGLARISIKGLPKASNEYKYDTDGKGVKAYILDTGIRDTHVEFYTSATDSKSRASNPLEANFIPGEAIGDFNGHGTHVAGTVGGLTVGVAKQVQLIGVKVLSASGSGSWAGVIAGIDWAAEDSDKDPDTLGVLNMSLGGGKFQAVDDATIAASLEVVVSVASGNNGGDAINTSPGGLGNSSTAVLSVGAIQEAPVGSMDTRASFSNFGASVSLHAPGVSVRSAWYTGDSEYVTISGTSMASPHVCGVTALVYPEIAKDIYLPDTVKLYILEKLASTNTIANLPANTPNIVLYSGCGVDK